LKTENLSTLKIHKLTQEQYDRELEAGRIDENAIYLTPDEEVDLSKYATIEQLKTKANVASIERLPGSKTHGWYYWQYGDASGTAYLSKTGAEVFNAQQSVYVDETGIPMDGNIAEGEYSHAEGYRTITTGRFAHSEGWVVKASGEASHAEGNYTTSSGYAAHAEGSNTLATGNYAHVEGYYTTASGMDSHAEGYHTVAAGADSHAEGFSTKANGVMSHAEGSNTQATGNASHAEGYNTIAAGEAAHAEGWVTTALQHQHASGKYNALCAGPAYDSTQDYYNSDAIFLIGYGTSSLYANAFRVASGGKCFGTTAFGASGADFAELFEWADGNAGDEDRRGLFVVLDGEKIRLANAGDDFIGVISGAQAFIGNSASEEWHDKYLTDVFGTRLSQEVEIPEKVDEKTGKVTTPAHTAIQYVVNPDYDPEKPYVMRENRKEWGIVGLLGQVVVIDDGTCVVGGYVAPSVNGVGTASSSGYRVMKRIDETHIKVLVK
jgi:hypothetical protein